MFRKASAILHHGARRKARHVSPWCAMRHFKHRYHRYKDLILEEDNLVERDGGGYVIKAPSLKYLNMSGKKEWWNLLVRILDSSPKLQILKLIPAYYVRDEDCPVSGKWIQPKCVPECLVLNLEIFVWKSYKWRREDEKELATYILQNSRCLKKAIFSTKLGKIREMLNELTCVVRASSNSCHLVLKSE
ncbi:hypothetical protein YC2023_072652 [Brassica napus]